MADIEVARYALRTFRVVNPAFIPLGMPKRLGSVVKRGDQWSDGTCAARCLKGRTHTAPDESCTCGIYGTLSLDALVRQFRAEASHLVTVIAAEGVTIIGDTGLRTQYARVVAYWSPQRDIRNACAKQFTGATPFDDVHAMLAAYQLPCGEPWAYYTNTLAGPLTADTAQALAQQYLDLLGGRCTYGTLWCQGRQIAGPIAIPLQFSLGGTLEWATTTFPIPAIDGEVILHLAATADGPAVDQASLGSWTLSTAGQIVVTPMYTPAW